MKVLDVGCGRGKFLNMINSPKIGLDLSIKNLKIIKKMQYTSNLFLILPDGENLPIKNSSIDFVHFSSTLHHQPNYLMSLKESIRILKNQGLIYFSESNRNGIPFVNIIEKFARIRGHFYEYHSGIDIFKVFNFLKKSGISICNKINSPIRFDGTYFVLWYYDQIISALKNTLSHLFPFIKKNSFSIIKKIFSFLDSIIKKLLPNTYKTWIQGLFIKNLSPS